jgi:stage II sporulation protein D
MRRLALLALAVALVLSAPAHAASTLTIRGGGFGHGVGMSQYGALGYAQHGWGYRAILGHYYSGTEVTRLGDARDVRVLVAAGRQSVTLTGALTVAGAGSGSSRRLTAAASYRVVRTGIDKLALKRGGHRLGTFASPLRLETADGNAPIAVGGVGSYRGAIELGTTPLGTVNVIDDVGLEDYVRGVVANESVASWPAAALQAQAVAARTYAITTNRALGTQGFQQYADSRSQVYTGVAGEHPQTDAAVAATSGEVVTYDGEPAATFFFSTSGGHTEDIENSFLGAAPKPWLKGVDDPYDDVSPHHAWKPIRMTRAAAGRKLRGLVKGSFRGIAVVQRGSSGRVVRAEVVGTRGRTPVTGPQLKARFGLMDTLMYFSKPGAGGSPDQPAAPAMPATPAAPAGDGATGGTTAS